MRHNKQEENTMANTYSIRFDAIKEHLGNDNDTMRYEREISRLSIDVLAALRRCVREDDPCLELVALNDVLDDELYNFRIKRSA